MQPPQPFEGDENLSRSTVRSIVPQKYISFGSVIAVFKICDIIFIRALPLPCDPHDNKVTAAEAVSR